VKPKRFASWSDFPYLGTLYGVSGLFAVIIAGFLISVIVTSMPAWRKYGLTIITGKTWDLATDQFGGFPLIFGTLEVTAIALFFAIPIGVGTALAIVHLLPHRIRLFFSSLVELLAAVPSVVYGLWGLLVLAPWFSATVQPWLAHLTGGHFPFQAPAEGVSLLLAGMVLFVMVLPLIVALSRDVIAIVPADQVEGALSLGATKWKVIRKVVLPGARTGIVGAVTLATGRALGETIAVTLVIGNNPLLAKSLFSPAATIASIIANQFDSATAIQLAALYAIAVVLMAITALTNAMGRELVRRSGGRVGTI